MEVWKHVISNTIVRDEAYQAEVLREFNTSVSKSLSMKNVLQELVEVIRKGCHIETVYICIASGEQGYQMMYSNNPLHDRSFQMKTDNPLIGWCGKMKNVPVWMSFTIRLNLNPCGNQKSSS